WRVALQRKDGPTALILTRQDVPVLDRRDLAPAEGLARGAAQLPHVPLAVPPTVLGKNTIHAMQAGVVLGQAGLVSGLLRRIRDEVGPVRAVATGRWAPLIAPLCPELEAVDPYLTLEGIRLIVARNP
ncbi:MAG: type III pantothenate kinase, partial [Candidatus Bipolaricaulota bacterium]|nr:type III pantothenate kinase [Candidatus Bipolaricaulota bacterium]